MKAKFKVGEKVRVKRDLKVWEEYDSGCVFAPEMSKFKGKILTIEKYRNKSERYEDQRYETVETHLAFSNSMLERVDSEKNKPVSKTQEKVFSKEVYYRKNGRSLALEWEEIIDGLTEKEIRKKGFFPIPNCMISKKEWEKLQENGMNKNKWDTNYKKIIKELNEIVEQVNKLADKISKMN